MNPVDYLQLLKLAAPQTIVGITALAVLFIDLAVMREEPLANRFRMGGVFACFGCGAALLWMFNVPGEGRIGDGMLVATPLTQGVLVALLGLTILTALLSLDADFTEHVGEYYCLLLLAAVGMMFLVSTENLLMLFVALEMTSLSLYILTAFNKRSLRSAEAALKYFLFGGVAAAFTLFGLSLLYGLTNSISLVEIARRLNAAPPDALLLAALVLVVIGLGFKIAAAPFHLWAPDAYEGAPTPSAAFIASGSKVASFYVFARVVVLGFPSELVEGSASWGQFRSGWMPLLAVVAALSLLIGNVAAIAQTNVRRLLAYSAVAHAGYALLAILAQGPAAPEQGLISLLYYVITYALTALGAFGVVAVVEATAGQARLVDFAGLSRRAPLLSGCLLIFLLSLAGIPPLAGFFGKFYVFTTAAAVQNLGLLWLVILAVAMSAVSLYYYLQVLKQVYVVTPAPDLAALRIPVVSQVVIALLALGVVVLGCAPGLLLEPLLAAMHH